MNLTPEMRKRLLEWVFAQMTDGADIKYASSNGRIAAEAITDGLVPIFSYPDCWLDSHGVMCMRANKFMEWQEGVHAIVGDYEA